uniref:Peroxisomal adenine nucleotide transporter 1 n=1 Tax=Gongylonema pulchrum TaxID=637853 RepID=A0A183DEB4_9BILA
LDLVKNRMQLSGLSGKKEFRSSFHALRSIIANEGFLAIYNGLSAGLLRQATYTTTRLGIYTWLFEHFTTGEKAPTFATKAGIGLAAGAAGSLPPDQQRKYKNVFDALIRVVKEEGAEIRHERLLQGCGPTVLRAMVVNAAQLATYSQSKEAL